MAKIFLVIKAWKINIIFAALLKGDHLVSAGWGSWTPRTQGHFFYMGWSLEEQPVWPADPEGCPDSSPRARPWQGAPRLRHGCPQGALQACGETSPFLLPSGDLTSSHLHLCPPRAAHALQPGQLLGTQPNHPDWSRGDWFPWYDAPDVSPPFS